MAEKPQSVAHASGGTPNGVPNFRPINKLPKFELKALASKIVRPALYQVLVDDKGGATLAIGPKIARHVAENLAEAINTNVLRGVEKVWSNARITLSI